MKRPKLNQELAEEMGLHLGDGSMNYYNKKGFYQLRGHIIDDREHYFTRIKYLYEKLFEIKINLRNMSSTGVIGFQIWNTELVKFKENLGLPCGKKGNFDIPKTISNKKLFFAFLRGFFDTDGSIYFENRNNKLYPRIDIKTTSKQFSERTVELLNKYGIKATKYTYYRPEKNWKDLHSIIVRGKNVQKWINLIGSNNPKHKRKMSLVESSVNGPAEI